MDAASANPVDVVGVGLNATDTIIRLPHFPASDSKLEVRSSEVRAGGQVASAMVACQRWGLSTRYVGKIGDDSAGKLQFDEMKREGVDARWIIASGCASQTSHILVDEASGERTVLWSRDSSIALRAEELKREWISGAGIRLVDGHDTEAAAQAARWAREEQIPVVGDFDNRYLEVEALLECVDFAVTSRDFPKRLTGDADLLKALPQICRRFKCRMAGATLGKMGAQLWDGERFLLSPAFRVRAVDTTGAGGPSLHDGTGALAAVHLYVSSRRDSAHSGQHVVPVDFRGQCGGSLWISSVPSLLSSVRHRIGDFTGSVFVGFAHSVDWR